MQYPVTIACRVRSADLHNTYFILERMFRLFEHIEVTCPDCRTSTVKLPRPLRPVSFRPDFFEPDFFGPDFFGPEWSAIPCPQCGRNLSVEAKQELAAREAKEVVVMLAIGAVLIALVVWWSR